MNASWVAGSESEVEEWLEKLVSSAVKGVGPALRQLHDHLLKVAEDASRLCAEVNEKAFQVFQERSNEMDQAWKDMQAHFVH